MSLRIKILLAIMVLMFSIMMIATDPILNWVSLVSSIAFCCAAIGLTYLHATRKKETISGGALFLQSAMASIACSVALFIILRVVLIISGLDFSELIDAKYIPAVILFAAALCFPFFWRILE